MDGWMYRSDERTRERQGGNTGEEMDDGKVEGDKGHNFVKGGQVSWLKP